MSVSNYAYVYARIRARMSDSLDEERFRTFVNVENKDDFLSSLMTTSYKEKMMKMTSKDLRNVEKALKEELTDQYLMVIRSTRGEIRALFVELLRKFEVENLKAIIRTKTTTTVTGEVPLFHPVESFFRRKISKLMEVESIESVIKLLEGPYKSVLKEVVDEYERRKEVWILENALDKEIFGAIWGRIERLKPEDREIVRRIIGIEFDIVNLMVLLRRKFDGVEDKGVRQYFFPYAFYFDLAEANASISAEDVSTAIRLFPPPFKEELEKVIPLYEEKKSLIPFEHTLRKFFLRAIKNTLRNYPINIGTIIGFLYLKEMEIKNLCAIAVCKENKIPVEEIMKIMIA